MKEIQITIAGMQYSDPKAFVQGIAHCFDVETHFVPFSGGPSAPGEGQLDGAYQGPARRTDPGKNINVQIPMPVG